VFILIYLCKIGSQKATETATFATRRKDIVMLLIAF